jgi:hypothetical protein
MYAARFPRYRKVMEDAGYGEALEAVSQAWLAGERDKARRRVPAGLLDEMYASACCQIRQSHRHSALALPRLWRSIHPHHAAR